MFLKIQIDENTRRMSFEDSKSTAGIVGDSNVDGIIFNLPENSEYFEFRNAVVFVIFFDATNKSHRQLLDQVDDYYGMPKWTFDDNVLKNDATSRVSFFLHMVISDTSGKVLKSWNTLPSNVIVYKNRDYDNQEEEATRETDIDRLAGLVTTLTEKAKSIGDVEKVLSSITGSAPKPVDTRAKMVDDGHIYLYTGDETGFTTGALYYYVDGTLAYGGVYGSYDLDTTLTETGKAADAKVVGDKIAEVKEDLSGIQTATSEDVGKALKAKTVTNGKVTEWEFGETGDKNAVPFPVSPESQYGTSGQVLQTLGDGKTKWVNVGEPDPIVIENAVSDWLDEHPDATTTVEDGSITEAKLATALVPSLKNGYVTPEMFGAVGDGVADDTQAIKDMFASGSKAYLFDKQLYKVTGGIEVNNACNIFFTETTLKCVHSLDVRDFEYVISFHATNIKTFGRLIVNCDSSANIGVYLDECGGSSFDSIKVVYARVWGIATNTSKPNLGSMSFHYISAVACGSRVNAKAYYDSTEGFKLSNVRAFTRLTDAAIRSAVNCISKPVKFLVDDSNYQDNAQYSSRRFAWGVDSNIVVDENDVTSWTCTKNYGGFLDGVPYGSVEEPRDIFIPFGGGILLQSSRSEGVFRIDSISTMRNPVSTVLNMQYGGSIANLSSQYDTIVMFSYALAANIDYFYLEAVGTGFKVNDKHNRIYLISNNNNCSISVVHPFIGTGQLAFSQDNEIICQEQENDTSGVLNSNLTCLNTLVYRKLNELNKDTSSTAVHLTINEYSPSVMCMSSPGLNGDNYTTVTITLRDIYAKTKNAFTVKTFYCNTRSDVYQGDPFSVRLSQTLVDNGYTLFGKDVEKDRVRVIPSNYGHFFKVVIMLFQKTFYVTAEPLTFIDNTQSEGT